MSIYTSVSVYIVYPILYIDEANSYRLLSLQPTTLFCWRTSGTPQIYLLDWISNSKCLPLSESCPASTWSRNFRMHGQIRGGSPASFPLHYPVELSTSLQGFQGVLFSTWLAVYRTVCKALGAYWHSYRQSSS